MICPQLQRIKKTMESNHHSTFELLLQNGFIGPENSVQAFDTDTATINLATNIRDCRESDAIKLCSKSVEFPSHIS